MPPKNASKGGNTQSKKTEAKKKEKIIEDKTFGLKNKKGSKQQKFIQQVQHQVKTGGNKSARQVEKEKEDAKKEKENKKKELAEINALFKPVQQMAAKGADPKSVLCAFFKQGTCTKGPKCKFSHDLNVERKGEKRSMFTDLRDEAETNEDWDEATLLDVVEKKHGKEKNQATTTTIVCKFFLDAVEQGKYGWFWECPNGEKCIYRHALPPGYVLKKDRKKEQRQQEISIEELVERERAALGLNTTKVTLETFLAWKRKKLKEKEERERKAADKKKSDYKSGRDIGLSGREMFTFNPSLMDNYEDGLEDGDESVDVSNLHHNADDSDDESRFQFREIDLGELVSEYRDDNVAVDNPTRLQDPARHLPSQSHAAHNGMPAAEECGAVAIDEELFADDDLDELEEQLDELELA